MHRPPPRLHAPDWFRADDSALNVALVYPMQGPAGIFGPTCEACARLAAEEINKAGGVLGRELRLLEVDGGAAPARVAEEVEALVATGVVQGVTGWHISSVRQAVAPRIAHRRIPACRATPGTHSPPPQGRGGPPSPPRGPSFGRSEDPRGGQAGAAPSTTVTDIAVR